VIARIFGLVGPDQPPNYLLPGLISRVRENRLAEIPGLHHLRDYLDTRDVCRHLVALARDLQTRGPRGTRIVNLCSGEATAVEEILNRVLEIQYSGDQDGLARALSEVSAAPGRPTDAHRVVGDPTRLLALGCEPIRSIPLDQTVLDAIAV
jgi:nucleoside-diphosphate-sugar epimerase